MDVNKVKALAARTFDVGVKRIVVNDPERAAEAITREDVRQLLKEKALKVKPLRGASKGRARKIREKKKAGRRSGQGKRKGTKKVRTKAKRQWLTKIRSQRKKLKTMMPANYRRLYRMVKGGFFKSVKHLESFVMEAK